MKKIGVFYGSSTGTTEDIAQRIADKLALDVSDLHNIADTPVDNVTGYEVLILGSSTWGVGDLQDDWEDFLPKLKKIDLSNKAVAIFGTGDSSSYSDSFCDAIGTIYKELGASGCSFCGSVAMDGYTFDDSTAVVGGTLVGLPLDEINEDNLTDKRLDNWITQLKQECLG